jgi:acetate kinase
MKVLVLNRGSSSLKCSIFSFSSLPEDFIKPIWETTNQKDVPKVKEMSINCIGHRIVHGGKKYRDCVLIDLDVKNEIKKLSHLAPLHNLADLQGIKIMEKWFPNTPQFAVFDTAFHHTLSKEVTTYPGPYEWIEMGIERFGFHGISFQYCTKTAYKLLGKDPNKMVICHLGSGASLCAVKNGKSIDTTMGFTPLEGLMMDTRSGTIDPGILLYLLENKGKTPQALSKELYEKSGLLGLSQISGDMRTLLEKKTDPQVKLALDVYLHRLSSMIGAMIASLEGLDTLVFTGGIGENSPFIRNKICHRLKFLGVELSKKPLNGNALLSTPNSKVQVLLIHTQEAFEIARQCFKKTTNL